MSKSVVEIRKAVAADAVLLAGGMRAGDRAEFMATGVVDVEASVLKSIEQSSLVYSAFIDGRIACIFGVGGTSLIGAPGAVWLLGTDLVETHYRTFARGSVAWRDYFLARYPLMMNAVDERNTVAKRWLKWLGAMFLDVIPVGPDNVAFRAFELRKQDV